MNRKLYTLLYIIGDWFAAVLAWTIFNYYRKTQVDSLKTGQIPDQIFDQQYFLSICILPLIWTLVYYLSG